MKILIVTAAVLVAIASPAFAQSFNQGYGKGSQLTYGSVANYSTQTVRRNGENANAMALGTGAWVNPNRPALTGGGSLGYDSMVSHW